MSEADVVFSSWDDGERADFALLQNGAVNLFWRKTIYNEAREDLRALNYHEIAITYGDFETFLLDVSGGLRWQERFGYPAWNGNLDALNDGLSELPSDKLGVALCIEDFDLLVARDGEWAKAILDIFELNSRMHLLFGRRLIGLFQTNDPRYEAPGLGGRNASWNRKEWLWSDRGI
jgi:hypothetical protein